MRRGLGQMFAVLNAALAHDIEEQDAALPVSTRYSKADAKSPGSASPEIAGFSVDMFKSVTPCGPGVRFAPRAKKALT